MANSSGTGRRDSKRARLGDPPATPGSSRDSSPEREEGPRATSTPTREVARFPSVETSPSVVELTDDSIGGQSGTVDLVTPEDSLDGHSTVDLVTPNTTVVLTDSDPGNNTTIDLGGCADTTDSDC